MTNTNVIRILNALYAGFPIKIDGYDYYLGSNNMLGIKADRYIDNVKQPDDGTIQGVDWSLKDFLTVCEQMSEQEIEMQCSEAERKIAAVESDTKKITKSYASNDERKYKIKSNQYLFKYPNFLNSQINRLNNIVQNDNVIPLSDLKQWLKDLTRIIYKLLDYAENIVYYIKYNQEPKIDPDASGLLDDTLILDSPWPDDDIPF